MHRRACALVAAAALVLGAGSAVAAPKPKPKPKPKPIVVTYNLTLYPDPTPNATGEVDASMYCGTLPSSTDKHAFVIPAAGTLKVVLDSPDPTKTVPTPFGPVGTDWDLYIVDASDDVLTESASATSHEETTTTFKKKESIWITVCNLAGMPDGTVKFTFTYK